MPGFGGVGFGFGAAPFGMYGGSGSASGGGAASPGGAGPGVPPPQAYGGDYWDYIRHALDVFRELYHRQPKSFDDYQSAPFHKPEPKPGEHPTEPKHPLPTGGPPFSPIATQPPLPPPSAPPVQPDIMRALMALSRRRGGAGVPG